MNNLLLILCWLPLALFSQMKVEVFYEKNANGYILYANNGEYCPASMRMDLELQNLRMEGENHSIYILKPNQNRQYLTTLTIENKELAYKFHYKTLYNYGDVSKTDYDDFYDYYLPFKINGTYRVSQGYNGKFSHQNKNALDFNMPVGTQIFASREGLVVRVEESNDKACPTEDCVKLNNFITIYHSDGTFAEYDHIQKNGSIVSVGDYVQKGQHIGYSGNVGWSNGPHLHIVIYKQLLDSRETLKTRFLVGKGDHTEYLLEKNSYSRYYR